MLICRKHKRGRPLSVRTALTLGLSAQLGLLPGCGSESGGDAKAAAGPVAPAAIAQAGSRPRAVQATIDDATRLCRAGGGQIAPEAGFDTRLDLNGDGVPDHIIDFRKLECAGASDDYFGPARSGDDCGPVGCRAQVFLSSPNGHVQAFNDQVWRIEVDRAVQPPRLKISTHGGPECQASAAEGCHAYWAWSGGAFVRTGWTSDGAATSYGAASASAAPGELPIREGGYLRLPNDPEFTGGWSITNSAIEYSDSASESKCQIESRETNGLAVRLNLRCHVCNEDDGCSTGQYKQPYTISIRAESPEVISVNGAPIQSIIGNGRYRYEPPLQD